MRKIIFLLAFTMFLGFQSKGQHRPGKKYLNVGYSSQNLKMDYAGITTIDLDSDIGATLNFGRTFYLLKNPVANRLYFGIDVTFLDLNYTKATFIDTEDDDEEYLTHKAEVNMQVGPSVHLNIVDKLTVSGHVRYAPGYSMMYADDEFSSGYVGFVVAGLALNYGPFGLGFETRSATANHNFSVDAEEIEEGNTSTSVDRPIKLYGNRIYLAFRF